MAAAASASLAAVVVEAAVPAPAISCRQGEFNNQQKEEAATEGSGVGTDGRTMMVISNRRHEVVQGGMAQRLNDARLAAGSRTAPPPPMMTEG